jgi:hypothetical protein
VKSVAAGQIEGAVKDRVRVILRSPDVIARTYREVQVQAGRERAELAGQKERLEARLAELKRMIRDLVQAGGNDGTLARSDDSNGAFAAELRKVNEEYSDTQNRVEEVGHALEALGSGGPDEDVVRQALQKLDPLWDELFPAEKERIVKLLVQEVVVNHDALLIRLRLHGLNSLVAELNGDGPVEVAKDGRTVNIHMPMEFKVRGGRKEIILPADAEAEPKAQPNRPLVLALARAHHWQLMIDSGEVASIDAIAARCGLDRTYVSRILDLAVLAPDLTQAALKGKDAGGLSLRRLANHLPSRWDEQRRCLQYGT